MSSAQSSEYNKPGPEVPAEVGTVWDSLQVPSQTQGGKPSELPSLEVEVSDGGDISSESPKLPDLSWSPPSHTDHAPAERLPDLSWPDPDNADTVPVELPSLEPDTPFLSSGEFASVDSAHVETPELTEEQADMLSYLRRRLSQVWGESYSRRTAGEYQDEFAGLIDQASRLAKEINDFSSVVAIDNIDPLIEEVEYIRSAVGQHAQEAETQRQQASSLEESFSEVGLDARRKFGEYEEVMDQFRYIYSKLTETGLELSTSSARRNGGLEVISKGLFAVQRQLEDLKYSRSGHETFGIILQQYAAHLMSSIDNARSSQLAVERHVDTIENLVGDS